MKRRQGEGYFQTHGLMMKSSFNKATNGRFDEFSSEVGT